METENYISECDKWHKAAYSYKRLEKDPTEEETSQRYNRTVKKWRIYH